MGRLVVLAAALLSAPLAVAEVPLVVVTATARDFDLTASTGDQPQHCTLPSAGGSRLSLSPGPLHLRVRSGDRTREFDETLPDTPTQLTLDYRSPGMAYAGLALLGGGLLAAAATVACVVGVNNTPPSSSPNGNNNINIVADVFGAIFFGIVAAGLDIAGGVLTGIGFARTGPTIDLSDAAPAPLRAPAS